MTLKYITMGRLSFDKKNNSDSRHAKTLSKGQRLGWEHKSTYQPITLCSFSMSGKKLSTYKSGSYSANKLVP